MPQQSVQSSPSRPNSASNQSIIPPSNMVSLINKDTGDTNQAWQTHLARTANVLQGNWATNAQLLGVPTPASLDYSATPYHITLIAKWDTPVTGEMTIAKTPFVGGMAVIDGTSKEVGNVIILTSNKSVTAHLITKRG